MTDEQRAEQYARLFEHLGDGWEYCVPVDGKVRGSSVTIGSVTLTRSPSGTWTTEGNQ